MSAFLVGTNWMISRMKKGLSVLLADEMGLGKTVQTISVIGHLMYAELLSGPFLVIVPQSTADNWAYEFKVENGQSWPVSAFLIYVFSDWFLVLAPIRQCCCLPRKSPSKGVDSILRDD